MYGPGGKTKKRAGREGNSPVPLETEPMYLIEIESRLN